MVSRCGRRSLPVAGVTLLWVLAHGSPTAPAQQPTAPTASGTVSESACGMALGGQGLFRAGTGLSTLGVGLFNVSANRGATDFTILDEEAAAKRWMTRGD